MPRKRRPSKLYVRKHRSGNYWLVYKITFLWEYSGIIYGIQAIGTYPTFLDCLPVIRKQLIGSNSNV